MRKGVHDGSSAGIGYNRTEGGLGLGPPALPLPMLDQQNSLPRQIPSETHTKISPSLTLPDTGPNGTGQFSLSHHFACLSHYVWTFKTKDNLRNANEKSL